MPPQSRGDGQLAPPVKPPPTPTGFQSRSTPNLPTLRSFHSSSTVGEGPSSGNVTATPEDQASPDIIPSPSEPASVDDYSLDSTTDRPSFSTASSGADDDDSEEDEDDALPKAPPRPFSHDSQRSRSYVHLAPQAFAPPFYGRPPTPLPPSPSLTSLLRPTFSSQFNSRPTTPDPSSDEGGSTPNTSSHLPTASGTGSQTPNSAAASTLTNTYRTAKPIPRASPKVPTYEYYGFTLYLASSLAFIVYLLWSFLPSPFLHQLGIYYYPNRWWALAIPAWTVMFVLYIYVALASYNTGYLTLSMDSVECLVDEAANVAVVDTRGKLIHEDRPSWQAKEKPRGKKEREREKAGKKKSAGGRSRQGSLSADAGLGPGRELDWRSLWTEGTDAVMDIPIGGVCEILYGRHDDSPDDDVSGNAHDR